MSTPRHRPIFRSSEQSAVTRPIGGAAIGAAARIVLTVRGKRYVVHARPARHPIGGGGRFSFGPRGPQRIAPGGCDEFEGEAGHMYICCKSHDGGHVNCYRIIHQDPWGPPLP